MSFVPTFIVHLAEFERRFDEILADPTGAKVWEGDHPNCRIECFVHVNPNISHEGVHAIQLTARHYTSLAEVIEICENARGPVGQIVVVPPSKAEFATLLLFWGEATNSEPASVKPPATSTPRKP